MRGIVDHPCARGGVRGPAPSPHRGFCEHDRPVTAPFSDDDVISRRLEGSVWVVELRGDLDLSRLDELRGGLEAVVAEGAPVVVDLAGVRFIDSTILALLLVSSRSAARGLALVVEPGGSVARLLELANVSRHVAVFASREEAERALAPPSG
jgi:anti-sigma B factor antagonist